MKEPPQRETELLRGAARGVVREGRWARVPSGLRAPSGTAEGPCAWLSGGRREATLGTSDIVLSGGQLGTSKAFKQKSESLWLP